MKSIQTKFVALILACVLLSSIAIGGSGLVLAQKVVDGHFAQILNLLCQEKQREMDTHLAGIEYAMGYAEDYSAYLLNDAPEFGDPAVLAEYLDCIQASAKSMVGRIESVAGIYLKLAPSVGHLSAGVCVNSAGQACDPKDYFGWDSIPLDPGESGWTEPIRNEKTDSWAVFYNRPLYWGDQFLGMMGAYIDGAVFEEIMDTIDVYEQGYAFLADDQGNIVYHHLFPFNTPIASVDESLESLVDELKKDSSQDTLFVYQWQEGNKTLAFRTLRNGMHLAATVPAEEISEVRNQLLFKNILILLGVAGISIVLGVWFARRLIRPLKELDAAAKKVATGNLSVEIAVHTHDEVGTLAESFQKTVEMLRKHIGNLNGLAYRDAMTGVKNKTAYLEAAQRFDEKIQSGGARFGFVMLDVNYLKQTNDTYGHDYGDQLIIDGCRLICTVFQHSPVYRFGGDEFAVILEKHDLDHVTELLEEFDERRKKHNESCDPKLKLSISKGYAIYAGDTDASFADVFKRADNHMYENKKIVKAREPWEQVP